MATVFHNIGAAFTAASKEISSKTREIRFVLQPSGGWVITVTESIVRDRHLGDEE